MLRGPEVKSLRDGKANLTDSYASVERSEVWLYNFHINPYSPAQLFNLHPTRKRKLLLNRREINKLIGRAQEKGYTLVPLKVYFKNGIAKVELSIAKAKKLHDKRASIKKREAVRAAWAKTRPNSSWATEAFWRTFLRRFFGFRDMLS